MLVVALPATAWVDCPTIDEVIAIFGPDLVPAVDPVRHL